MGPLVLVINVYYNGCDIESDLEVLRYSSRLLVLRVGSPHPSHGEDQKLVELILAQLAPDEMLELGEVEKALRELDRFAFPSLFPAPAYHPHP